MEYGIPVAAFELAKNEDETVKSAEQLGYPVVLKIVSPDILHKTDAGEFSLIWGALLKSGVLTSRSWITLGNSILQSESPVS